MVILKLLLSFLIMVIKKPVVSYKGIPEKNEENAVIFDIEDEIMNICRTFSMNNKKQQQNLIETLKQNCRRIVREKTEKNLLLISILQGFNGYYRFYNCLCYDLVDNIFLLLPVGIQSNKEVFKEKIGGMDPGAPKILK